MKTIDRWGFPARLCVKTIVFTSSEMQQIAINAKLIEMGGVSQIRPGAERLPYLGVDQYTGQAGEAALSKYLTGNMDLYLQTRAERNRDRTKGDNGRDLLGLDVDIKTSRMRRSHSFDYRLWVRPHEYHKEVCYYLGLMDVGIDDLAFIVGWCGGEWLPKVDDRYEIPMSKLNGMDAAGL